MNILSNKIIIKNYLALTFLQIINAFFYIIIFPVVVPVIGIENYGMFVYVTAILSFVSILVSFGFELPGLKKAASTDAAAIQSVYFISVFFLKTLIYLLLFVVVIVSVNIFVADGNRNIYFLGMIGVLSNVFIFSWYYQGKQKVTVLATIQAVFKLISLFLVVVFVSDKDDFVFFVFIVNFLGCLGGLCSLIYLFKYEKISIHIPSLSEIYKVYFEALPFFWASSIGVAKYKSVEVIIGSFFGLGEVALYDLANKIYSIPSVLSTSINTSIFPKLSKVKDKKIIKKVFFYEFFLAVAIFISVVLFGGFAVEFLGKGLLQDSYSLLLVMTLNIFAFLIVGCYVYFVFIPNGKNYLIFKNQIVALISFFCFLVIFLTITWSVYSVIFSLVFSGFIEILYCNYMANKINQELK